MHISDVAWNVLAKIGGNKMAAYIAGIFILAAVATVIVGGIFIYEHYKGDGNLLRHQIRLFKNVRQR